MRSVIAWGMVFTCGIAGSERRTAEQSVSDVEQSRTVWGTPFKKFQIGIRCPRCTVGPRVEVQVLIRSHYDDKFVRYLITQPNVYIGAINQNTGTLEPLCVDNDHVEGIFICPGQVRVIGRVWLGMRDPAAGESSIPLPPGDYLIGTGDFTRPPKSESSIARENGRQLSYRSTGYLGITVTPPPT